MPGSRRCCRRWTLGGQQVQPAIARYLMDAGYVAENGKTEFGARTLALTADGGDFRRRGMAWWASLSVFGIIFDVGIMVCDIIHQDRSPPTYCLPGNPNFFGMADVNRAHNLL